MGENHKSKQNDPRWPKLFKLNNSDRMQWEIYRYAVLYNAPRRPLLCFSVHITQSLRWVNVLHQFKICLCMQHAQWSSCSECEASLVHDFWCKVVSLSSSWCSMNILYLIIQCLGDALPCTCYRFPILYQPESNDQLVNNNEAFGCIRWNTKHLKHARTEKHWIRGAWYKRTRSFNISHDGQPFCWQVIMYLSDPCVSPPHNLGQLKAPLWLT